MLAYNNPQRGYTYYFSNKLSDSTIQTIIQTGKDANGAEHLSPLEPAYRGLLVELYRRVRKVKFDVTEITYKKALYKLVQYCTNVPINEQRLDSIAQGDCKKWENASRTVDKVFPRKPEYVVSPDAVTIKDAQHKTKALMRELDEATHLIQQLKDAPTIQQCGKRKRKHTKALNEMSHKHQRQVMTDLVEELTERFNDNMDNIVLCMLSLNRPAAIKLAMQLEGISDTLSKKILDEIRFTPKELVQLMVCFHT